MTVSGLFKNQQQRRQAKLISELATCNPFFPERIDLERQILGKDFRNSPDVMHKQDEFERVHLNLALIMKRTASLVDDFQGRMAKKDDLVSGSSEEEIGILQDVMKFHLYHQYRLEFDDYIRECVQLQKVPVPAFYSSFEFSWKKLFSMIPEKHRENQNSETSFAFFFQIRRAFYHIYNFLIGYSQPMARLRGEIWQSIFSRDLARYEKYLKNRMNNISTLILGPSGTGKEIVARAIARSAWVSFDPASKKFAADFQSLFIPINVSALSPTLVESELFGHNKGAFTGAESSRTGFLEQCHISGTVFLDEIGDLDQTIQVKLLRVLQDRTFYRLGDTESIPFRGRIIAATNRDLSEEMDAERFRSDLYFRLCSDIIQTPGLSEQIQDNPETLDLLVRHISRQVLNETEEENLATQVLHWISENLNEDYPWSGNIRELEQVVRGVMMKGMAFNPQHIHRKSPVPEDRFQGLRNRECTLVEAMELYTRHLHEQSGSVQETARRLNVDRRTVKKYLA